MRQYMPIKAIKRGYRVWIRADEYGYICEFQINTEKVNSNIRKSSRGKSSKSFVIFSV